ncbi:hypothetical protein BN871_BW_00190 [Paenibacillus sp. P22]|nr:hypothetical protein BN871_BW_00190 [Paenibacillus sp. P22]
MDDSLSSHSRHAQLLAGPGRHRADPVADRSVRSARFRLAHDDMDELRVSVRPPAGRYPRARQRCHGQLADRRRIDVENVFLDQAAAAVADAVLSCGRLDHERLPIVRPGQHPDPRRPCRLYGCAGVLHLSRSFRQLPVRHRERSGDRPVRPYAPADGGSIPRTWKEGALPVRGYGHSRHPVRLFSLYGSLILLALFVLGPLLYLLAQSFMTPAEAGQYPPKLLPSGLYTGGLKNAIETVPIFGFIVNSFVLAIAIMVLQVLTAALAAYAFVYIRFSGSRFWFALFISTMMIPWEVTIIPNYLTVKSWGWLDSFQGLIVPFAASAFGVFLLRQFFLQLPRELFEAARIDGCGHFRHFVSVVLPLSGPAAASLAVYVFLNGWNQYLWPLLITSSDAMRTVQIGIAMLQFEELTSWNLVLCGVALVLVPSLVLLALGLKPLVRGITAGAVKG